MSVGTRKEAAMRRHPTISLVVGLLLAMATGSAAAASNHRRSDATGHTLVGMWVVDVDSSGTLDAPALLTVSRDGTMRFSDCCSSPSAGVWAARGRRGADVNVLLPRGDGDGYVGFNTLRGSVEVSQDGQSFTATYTMDIPIRGEGTSGQLGPVAASGVRVDVEPMGEAVGPVPSDVAPPAEPDDAAAPDASPAPDSSVAPEA
jgi:hypothetical protein